MGPVPEFLGLTVLGVGNVPFCRVTTREKTNQDSITSGTRVRLGEKYCDVVRVVQILGLSVDLCDGTHVRNTGQVDSERESGVAADS